MMRNLWTPIFSISCSIHSTLLLSPSERVWLRRTAAAFSFAVLVLAGPPSAAAVRPPSGPARMAPGIVEIGTNLGSGSAAPAGLGLVLRSSGEVVTANDVIRGATSIRATDLDSGRSFQAAVVGYDQPADLAVLQLKGPVGLKTARLGSATAVKVGQPVTVLENADSLRGMLRPVSTRVVALHQSVTSSDEYGTSEQLSGLIETSAALEPGDSGGPLLDAAGQVIGMDTAAPVGFLPELQLGRGYVIPINTVTTSARAIERGEASIARHVGPTAFLGVSVEPFDYFDGSQLSPAALVVGVVPGSPAEKAGLGLGDVITTLDGHKITSPGLLGSLVLGKKPGVAVRLGWESLAGKRSSALLHLTAGPPQ